MTEHKPIAQPEDGRYWYEQYLTVSVMLLERFRMWQEERDRANLLDKDVDELEAENNRLRDDCTAAEKAAEELADELEAENNRLSDQCGEVEDENAALKQKLEEQRKLAWKAYDSWTSLVKCRTCAEEILGAPS